MDVSYYNLLTVRIFSDGWTKVDVVSMVKLFMTEADFPLPSLPLTLFVS